VRCLLLVFLFIIGTSAVLKAQENQQVAVVPVTRSNDDKAFDQYSEGAKQTRAYSADTSKINTLLAKANACLLKGQLNEALSVAIAAQHYSSSVDFKKGTATGLMLQGIVLNRKGVYDSAIFLLNQSLPLVHELNDSMLLSTVLLNIGNAYVYLGKHAAGLEYFFDGLAIEGKLRLQSNLFRYFNNIGLVFTYQKNNAKALEYTQKAIELAEKNNDKERIGTLYNNLGLIYMQMNKNDSAFVALRKALQFSEIIGDKYTMTLCLSNLAELVSQRKQYEEAFQYNYRSYQISKAEGYSDLVAFDLVTMGSIRIEQGRYNEAEKYLLEGYDLAKEIKSQVIVKDVLFLVATLYQKKQDYEKAYDYFQLYSEAKDSLLNQENSKLITEMNTKYTTEKKEKEIELLKKNEEIQKLELNRKRIELNNQQVISISILASFLLLTIVAALLFNRYRLKKRANDQLQDAYNLIEEKNKLIEKSNLMITDSILYAKRIQDAVLPAPKEISEILSDDFFIFYKPSDIVSGDFYWCSAQQQKTIFIVADCTGHGVPGAFMSMIGNTLLNEIINERKITCTKEIAELLDQKIIESLHQHSGSEQYDGMDISICCIDSEKKEISFTGAHHTMYVYAGQLKKIKGDPYSIGGAQQKNSKKFTSKIISYTDKSRLYFLTDGYCDQSGGDEKKRFTSRRFEKLLEEIQDLNMNQQQVKLETTFDEWRGSTKQRDDILVVGITVNEENGDS
jgi:tetratricopeptide (TPR) repeat protein/serine phosphatase RsbU (regulator of sigma subunit)